MNVFGDGDYDEETETVMEKVKKAQKKMTSEEKLLNAPIELVREGSVRVKHVIAVVQ